MKPLDSLIKANKAAQKIVRCQPLRINKYTEQREYLDHARKYKELTGKNFKRNSWDMHNKYTKLKAIKIRIRQIQDKDDLKSALKDIREKNCPDFNLLGAL
jgi:hypothetical protein